MKKRRYQSLVGLALVASLVNPTPWLGQSSLFESTKVLAAEEELPGDEDVPDANELKKISDARTLYNETLAMLDEENYSNEAKEFAKLDLDTIDLSSLRAMKYTSAKEIVALIDSLYAKINGVTPAPDPSPTVTEEKEVFPVGIIYIENPDAVVNTQTVLSEGTPGEITYKVTNGVRDQGTETTPMVPKRVSVGTKPTVVTEAIPAPADVEEQDPNLEEGKRELKTPAVPGSKTTTTTYTLDEKTGVATANEPTVEEKAGTAAVYLVGTKKVDVLPVVTTRTEVIAITTVYIADPTKEANTQEVTFDGVAGEKTYTTTDGMEDAGVVTTAMQPKRVTVGTKPTVVTEAIPAPADVEEQDPNLEEGKRELKTPAVPGSKTTTTTYTLDEKTGVVTANEPVVVATLGTPAVYRVGSKNATPIITRVVSEEVVTESIVFTKEIRDNKDLPKGTTRVVQEGKGGVRTIVYTVTTIDGQETSRVVKSDTTTPAVAEIVEVGAKESVSALQVEAKDDVQPKSDDAERQDSTPVESKKVLPQTGEHTSIFATFGTLLLAGILAFRRKKNKILWRKNAK
ncbi:TPA: G5 domain-containing protein [Streptococcus suis]|nr:G5 domain-containing protein [Streptococcus suis]